MVSHKEIKTHSVNPKKKMKRKKIYTHAKDKNNRVESAVFGRGFNLI